MKMKNTITDQFQKEAKVIFLAEDLLLAKLRANPDEVELEEIIHELRIHIRKTDFSAVLLQATAEKKEEKGSDQQSQDSSKEFRFLANEAYVSQKRRGFQQTSFVRRKEAFYRNE